MNCHANKVFLKLQVSQLNDNLRRKTFQINIQILEILIRATSCQNIFLEVINRLSFNLENMCDNNAQQFFSSTYEVFF